MINSSEENQPDLHLLKEEAESILSKLMIPILITSKKSRKIVYANPYAQKQYETSLEALLGMEVSELYTNDEQREKILSALKDDETVENLEMHWQTLKGNTFYGLLSLTAITFKGEECFMGMVKDITLQKEQDAKLAKQSKMEALGEMMGNVAHHWRQPLNAITVSASGLVLQQEMDILDKQVLIDELHSIEDEAKFLSRTIDDFRDLIDDANKHEKLNFSLNSTIEVALAINKFSFYVDLDLEKDIEIFGISNRLVQSISNILQNCEDIFETKLFEPEEMYVKLTTKITDETALIEIQDNGGGVPESIIDKVFEPYFTTAHQSPGKGLGLYNSLKMVSEDLGGTLGVRNKEFEGPDNQSFKGAMFFISIPLDLDGN